MYDDVPEDRETLVGYIRPRLGMPSWRDVRAAAAKDEVMFRTRVWDKLKQHNVMERYREPRVIVEQVINDGVIFVYDGDIVERVPLMGDWHG